MQADAEKPGPSFSNTYAAKATPATSSSSSNAGSKTNRHLTNQPTRPDVDVTIRCQQPPHVPDTGYSREPDPNRKAQPMRRTLLLAAAVAVAATAAFTTAPSDAQTAECPTGFTLTAQTTCTQPAATTTTNPTCTVGTPTPDGTVCYTPARIIDQSGVTACPDGYTPDDNLGGQCARFEVADQLDATCPTGARGEPGGCYILVALGPAGTPRCTTADTALGGVASSGVCVIIGDDPTPGPAECPVSATVKLDGTVCYEVISPAANEPVTCTAAADLGLVNGQCRRSAALTPTADQCAADYSLVASNCVRYTTLVVPDARCPLGSAEGPDGCRHPVADAAGAYTCPTEAALTGRACVYTTGFTADADEPLYMCDTGTRRIVTTADTVNVVCLHGTPTVSAVAGCLQGVLTADGTTCTVAVTTVTAPTPQFTG